MLKNYELLEEKNRSIVDINNHIYQYIYDVIYICLRFQSRYIGAHYLSEFIEDIIINDMYLYDLSPTKDIYPMIASKFKTTTSKVERAIRHSCTDAWGNIDENLKKLMFPYGSEKVATNSEMIYAIYEYIKGHYIFDKDTVKKVVSYKDGTKREETDNYINYRIRFEIQKFLYEEFNFTYANSNSLSVLLDAITIFTKYNKVLTDEDVLEVLKYLSDTYGFYVGKYYSYVNGFTDVSEIENMTLNFCNRIYQRKDETFVLQRPKNKTYIKEYMNVLSINVKEKLPFYL